MARYPIPSRCRTVTLRQLARRCPSPARRHAHPPTKDAAIYHHRHLAGGGDVGCRRRSPFASSLVVSQIAFSVRLAHIAKRDFTSLWLFVYYLLYPQITMSYLSDPNSSPPQQIVESRRTKALTHKFIYSSMEVFLIKFLLVTRA